MSKGSKLLNSPTFGEVLVLRIDGESLLSVTWTDPESDELRQFNFEFSKDLKGWEALNRSFEQARDDNIDFLIGGL